MRLWHQELIQHLQRQQLLGQHRECCALRGKGWGKKHSTIDYIFKYHWYVLYRYHMLVIKEMYNRQYNVNKKWLLPEYRGQYCTKRNEITIDEIKDIMLNDCNHKLSICNILYEEHNFTYLLECLHNLKNKGIILEDYKCLIVN